jgi:putative tricarboxylic transport membrane protein
MPIVDLVVHGPPGSAPPVMAAAILAGLAEAGHDPADFRLVPRGDDPGVDAMHLLADRPGDGDLLSTCTPVFIQAPLLRGMQLTHRQLTPLARLVLDRFFVVTRADTPWAAAVDFVDHIVNHATRTGGYFKGGINHLLALSIAAETGADVEFIITPSEPAVWVALMEGRLDWGCGVPAEILPHVEAGTLKVVAVLDAERRQPFGDVPALTEVGVPVAFNLWRGLIGPAGLSDAQQERWHEAAARLRETEAWQSYLKRNGQADGYLPGKPFADFLDTEWVWYEKHLRLAGLLRGAD